MDACRRIRLLVVDDEGRSARMLARMLSEDGYEVELAFNGAMAIQRLSRGPLPDALITDLRMPLVDGFAVASYARSRNSSMPIVFITGYPHRLQPKVAELGDRAIVHGKPIVYSNLMAEMSALLDVHV